MNLYSLFYLPDFLKLALTVYNCLSSFLTKCMNLINLEVLSCAWVSVTIGPLYYFSNKLLEFRESFHYSEDWLGFEDKSVRSSQSVCQQAK